MVTKSQKRRFMLASNGFIIDNLNPKNSRKYEFAGPGNSDTELRRDILRRRLDDLATKLIVGPDAFTARLSLWKILLAVIEASELNTLDPLISIRHPFKGKLKRKEGIRDYTSLMLFVRDVERVVRDLYGDLEEVDRVIYSIWQIVVEVMRFVRPELAEEYDNAQTIYYRFLPAEMRHEGEGVSGSEAGAAIKAAMDLAVRALQVSIDPKRCSLYTIKFVEALDKYWPKLGGVDRTVEVVVHTGPTQYDDTQT
jgi:hypothetical protein